MGTLIRKMGLIWSLFKLPANIKSMQEQVDNLKVDLVDLRKYRDREDDTMLWYDSAGRCVSTMAFGGSIFSFIGCFALPWIMIPTTITLLFISQHLSTKIPIRPLNRTVDIYMKKYNLTRPEAFQKAQQDKLKRDRKLYEEMEVHEANHIDFDWD